MGKGEGGSRAGLFKMPRRGEGRRGVGSERGSGGRPAVSEPRGGSGRLGEMMLTGGPGLSAGEREGKGEERSGRLGRSPGREKGSAGGGVGPKRPKGENKGRDSSFLFFLYQISK